MCGLILYYHFLHLPYWSFSIYYTFFHHLLFPATLRQPLMADRVHVLTHFTVKSMIIMCVIYVCMFDSILLRYSVEVGNFVWDSLELDHSFCLKHFFNILLYVIKIYGLEDHLFLSILCLVIHLHANTFALSRQLCKCKIFKYNLPLLVLYLRLWFIDVMKLL